MEFIKKLSNALNLEESQIEQALDLTSEDDSKQIAQKLGFYGLFQNKEEIEAYIKNKVQNKMKIIDELNSQLSEANNKIEDLNAKYIKSEESNAKYLNSIKDAFKNEWNRLNYDSDYDLSQIDASQIDLNNLSLSVKNYASQNNMEPNILKPSKIENDLFLKDSSAQFFEVGSKRMK